MDAGLAKGILDGIVSSVCRSLKIDPKLYRIKPGGSMLGQSIPEWYVTVQSPASARNVSRNTRRARRVGLIKTHFIVSGDMLKVHEWSAAKDWMQGETIVFEAPVGDMKARKAVAELFKAAVLRSRAADAPGATT